MKLTMLSLISMVMSISALARAEERVSAQCESQAIDFLLSGPMPYNFGGDAKISARLAAVNQAGLSVFRYVAVNSNGQLVGSGQIEIENSNGTCIPYSASRD